jgi:hypothetical protein
MSQLDINYGMGIGNMFINTWALPEFFKHLQKRGVQTRCLYCGECVPVLVTSTWSHVAKCKQVPPVLRKLVLRQKDLIRPAVLTSGVVYKLPKRKPRVPRELLAPMQEQLNLRHLKFLLSEGLVTIAEVAEFGLLVKIGRDWNWEIGEESP